MAGVIAGCLLIAAAVVCGGAAVYVMALSENFAMTLIKCVPLMFLAFILLAAGSVFVTA